jgi:hypothetical protein
MGSAAQVRSRFNNGKLDAALLPGGHMLTPSSPDTTLEQLLQGAARQVRGVRALDQFSLPAGSSSTHSRRPR